VITQISLTSIKLLPKIHTEQKEDGSGRIGLLGATWSASFPRKLKINSGNRRRTNPGLCGLDNSWPSLGPQSPGEHDRMSRPYPDLPVVLQLSLWAYISRAPTDGLSSLNRHNVSTDCKRHTRKLSGFYPQKPSFSLLTATRRGIVICPIAPAPLVAEFPRQQAYQPVCACIP